jgi:hypothetical protein
MIHLKLALGIAGLLLAVASVALDDQRLAWAAIAVLTGSLIVRLLLQKRDRNSSDDERPM